MESQKTLKYIIEDSAIAEMLGRQNFSNKISAILELVKNSYDAFAKKMYINISQNSIVIEDDGVGMDENDINNRWMHVGYSEKKDIYDLEIKEEKRILSGSKGVGRFALSRLGNTVEIKTKKRNCDAVLWRTDWDNCTIEPISKDNIGTLIQINNLRDKWTYKDVDELIKYLGIVYFDNKMEIHIIYDNSDKIVQQYFNRPLKSNNYQSKIIFNYDSSNSIINIQVLSDEFTDEAKKYYKEDDINVFGKEVNVYEELKSKNNHLTNDEFLSNLIGIGSFDGVFYFSVHPSNLECEKFCYKKDKSYALESGIVLYRNSFSISSYEGKKDWIELGKRSRISPAAATHKTGSWRVRENQLAGYVRIDKLKNKNIKEMSNRQGLEEDEYYNLFINIIHIVLNTFEKYRQKIIRAIDVKNNVEKRVLSNKVVNAFEKNPNLAKDMSSEELNKLSEGIKEIKDENKKIVDDSIKTEEKYKYDLRILNVLSTLGLKASSVAHELQNDRNLISSNYEKIIKRMKELNVWEIVDLPENKRKTYQNVPEMFEQYKKVNNKMINFMDIMLTNIEKSHFEEKTYDLKNVIEEICDNWARQYASLKFTIVFDRKIDIVISYDIIDVIFDNLILNSIQQNEKQCNLEIYIKAYLEDSNIVINYKDNGHGLVKKYIDDPMRILDVHETSRENGHGLGMWIVNNSLHSIDGKVMEIDGHNGFFITFSLGGKYNE